MAARSGGMLERGDVAAMFGVTPAAIDKQRQRRQILGVPYGTEIATLPRSSSTARCRRASRQCSKPLMT
jgi:hypothetical protein